MAEKTCRDIEVGFVVQGGGGAKSYRTGDWRSQKPCYDKDRCIKCGVCYAFCPDAAIRVQEDGYIDVNDFYCKGCGICSRECITGAFKMVPLDDSDKNKK